jgi:putative DNA primase/helicase
MRDSTVDDLEKSLMDSFNATSGFAPGNSYHDGGKKLRITDRMCNDTGNADRLVIAHGKDLMFCEQRESFAVWMGSHWKLDRSLIVSRMAEKVMLRAFEETATFSEKEERAWFFKFVNKSLQRAGIENMVVVAKRKVREIGAADFDGDPFLLNFTNGTLDLRTGILREARREDLISKCIPYAFDAEAECPTFHAFLNRIMGAGPNAMQAERNRADRLIGYLQRLLGCSLTGKPEKILAIFWGKGNNGKSTLLETVRAALGEEQYAGQLQIESLMAKHADAAGSNAINADLAGLQGCRFVTASEPEEGMKFSVSRLKYILGLSKIKARYLRENPFEFKPTHKLFVDCNHRPVITDPNDAIWNRVQLFPFDVEIPRAEIDTDLPRKLLGELPGIMAWLARGAAEYIKLGIEKIPEVAAATEEYREDSDTLKEFFEDRCRIAPTDRAVWVAKTDLFNAYLNWAAVSLIKFPMGKSKFEERIQRLGCRETRKEHNTIRVWTGICIATSERE